MSFSALLYVAIACLSAYGLSHSARSIPKLKKYEDKAERAAKWSNTADKRLWDTRYTVGAGCVLLVLSLLTSLVFIVSAMTTSSATRFRGTLWCGLLSAAGVWVSGYIQGFWKKEKKIPLMDEYNESISHTLLVMNASELLGYAWGLVAVFRLVGL